MKQEGEEKQAPVAVKKEDDVEQEEQEQEVVVVNAPMPNSSQRLSLQNVLIRLKNRRFTINCRKEGDHFWQVLPCPLSDFIQGEGRALSLSFESFAVVALRMLVEQDEASLDDYNISFLYVNNDGPCFEIKNAFGLETLLVRHMNTDQDSDCLNLEIKLKKKNKVPAAVAPSIAAATVAAPPATDVARAKHAPEDERKMPAKARATTATQADDVRVRAPSALRREDVPEEARAPAET